jgi:hypothetical protein
MIASNRLKGIPILGIGFLFFRHPKSHLIYSLNFKASPLLSLLSTNPKNW